MYDAPAMASKLGLTSCIGGLVLAAGWDPAAARAGSGGAAAWGIDPGVGSMAPGAPDRVVAKPRLEITAIPAAEAEDGGGRRVTAPPAPRALDLHADAWPGRALDPVLRVGELRFHHYTFPAKGVMRFVVDDVARLRAGDEVSLQWGDDASTRVVVTRSLEVPR
jgi:hypothetical protein